MRFSSLLAGLTVPVTVTIACTTVIISKEASMTGVPMLAHSADCINCDSRMALVPARDHAEGAVHKVYGINAAWPRAYTDRAAIYLPKDGHYTEPSATIPEVPHTYALWESVYPLMNEEGLTIGESSTTSTVPGGFSVALMDPKTGKFGEAQFSIRELIRIGLERCTTVKCAINEMGSTAEKYGFYPEPVGAGEALTIADTNGASWVFHVSHDSTGKSAVWAAQRVPEGHVAAIANQYTIQDIKEDEPENFMFSPNMKSDALKLGLWDGVAPFNFVKAFGSSKSKPTYTSIRMWAVYNLVAPALGLPFQEDPFKLPFSVPADKALSREDLMEVFRTNYEGTEFDMTQGVLAGMNGNPYRIEGGDGLVKVPGQFARGISIPRTTYTMLGYPDASNPTVYYATDAPGSSVFAPFLAKTLKEASANKMEESKQLYSSYYQEGVRTDFTRDSAWWAFDFVANWMTINYRNMSGEYVTPAVKHWQPLMIEASNTGLTNMTIEAQTNVVESWWSLADKLIVRYNDGYYNYPESDPESTPYMGYPAEWLSEIGFNNDFIRPHYVHAAGLPVQADTAVVAMGASWWIVVLTAVAALAVGAVAGRMSAKPSVRADNQKRLLAGH